MTLTTGFLLLGSGVAFALAPADQAQFQTANQNYKEGRFDRAALIYRSLSEKYPAEPVFFYNLGNAYQRLNNLSSSILAYERGLRLAPRDADIRYNLKFAQNQIEYRVEDKRNSFVRLAEQLLGWVSAKEALFAALFFYFILVGTWVFMFFTNRDLGWGSKRSWTLMLLIASLVLYGGKYFQDHFYTDAIVASKDAAVRSGPSAKDKIAFRLGEGIKVHILEDGDDWSRVVLNNGDMGWIETSQIAKVNQ